MKLTEMTAEEFQRECLRRAIKAEQQGKFLHELESELIKQVISEEYPTVTNSEVFALRDLLVDQMCEVLVMVYNSYIDSILQRLLYKLDLFCYSTQNN
jgi:hypothetical protein